MTSEDTEYYRGRIAEERHLARHAANPYARRAHQELADNYEILCRLLRPKQLRPARRQPMIERIEFTTLIQTLATPHSTYLLSVPGWSLPAPPERPVEPILTIAAE